MKSLAQKSLPYWCAFDIVGKEEEIARLEAEAAQPHFWLDQAASSIAMRNLNRLKETVGLWRRLERETGDLLELARLSAPEVSARDELASHVEEAEKRLRELEFQLLLGGKYQERDAILAIHAGAGGTESQDWTEMLLRMYLRWTERRGYRTEVLDVTPGEEAGIKSVTLEVTGLYAYGYLRAEKGVHRLVRLSPFDAAHARHTSFALVEAWPQAEGDVEVIINPEDLRLDVFRASGAGGQNVQKNSTAVRVTHLPTGLVVSCQDERSLARNRETALKILRARLMEIELEKKAEEQAHLKGEHVTAGWGNQIRSYVLHPYKMVKDHRTGHETSNVSAVLDGDLDELIQSYLRSRMGEKT
ncbi:MAG: peptide chain release factor 2 [Chloroflexi bacterium]|nr:peptide chain release factor 2 [Chloroflexota bacterium]